MITKEQRKIDLFNDLIAVIERETSAKEANIYPFHEWVVNEKILLDGRQFSYDRHEYLIEPYKDNHPFQVEMKATQLGLTSKALLRVVYGCRYGEYRGILYLFPSRTDVSDLSKGRLTPLIEDNPENIGRWIQETDSTNIKKIWKSFLYLRGMKSRIGLKSVPIDFEIFDELDEAPPNAVDMALERMAHSDIGEQLYLSNPTLPDYGIDKLFQLTDQQFYLLKCRHCNEYNDLVGNFPDCLAIVKGATIRICKKCGRELDPAYGVWVPKRPSITDKRGRQYSQLYAQTKASSPESILNKYLTTTNLTDFWNLKIGIAYVDAKNRLSKEQVFDCCGDQGMLSESSKGCFMGVDQGNNLHFVIGRGHESRRGELVHIGHLKGNNADNKNDDSGWRQLDEFMKRFKVMRCVVDAQPNTKLAREFSERFPGRVFLCYYSDSFKGNYRWDEEKMVVHANRTESLDASHMEISQVNVLLPRRSEIVDEFADHMHNIAKKLITDDETGSQKYQYFRLGDDHWRHAYNYEKMARDESPELLFPDL